MADALSGGYLFIGKSAVSTIENHLMTLAASGSSGSLIFKGSERKKGVGLLQRSYFALLCEPRCPWF